MSKRVFKVWRGRREGRRLQAVRRPGRPGHGQCSTSWHRIQAARRPTTSRCAGTARPASAGRARWEINGKPRLACMTPHERVHRRRDHHLPAASRRSQVMKGPRHRTSRGITSRNKKIPKFKPKPREGRRHVPDVSRGRRSRVQEFRRVASSATCARSVWPRAGGESPRP